MRHIDSVAAVVINVRGDSAASTRLVRLRPGAPRIKIGKGKAALFYEGNPIVFTNAVESTVGDPRTGDAVVVSDWKDTPLAWGVYNHSSLFKCRILQLNREVRPGRPSACAALLLGGSCAVSQLQPHAV